MNIFNVICGIATLASLIFAVCVHVNEKKRRAIEEQKGRGIEERLGDLLSSMEAIAKQTHLIGAMADREEVQKKELKHLAVSLLATVKAAQTSLQRIHSSKRGWVFGIPTAYLDISSKPQVKDPSPPSSEAT